MESCHHHPWADAKSKAQGKHNNSVGHSRSKVLTLQCDKALERVEKSNKKIKLINDRIEITQGMYLGTDCDLAALP